MRRIGVGIRGDGDDRFEQQLFAGHLNACPADSLKVQYDGALSPVLFRSKSEQAEVVQVIVPMRLAAE